jgi:hypothetical protein
MSRLTHTPDGGHRSDSLVQICLLSALLFYSAVSEYGLFFSLFSSHQMEEELNQPLTTAELLENGPAQAISATELKLNRSNFTSNKVPFPFPLIHHSYVSIRTLTTSNCYSLVFYKLYITSSFLLFIISIPSNTGNYRHPSASY